MADAVISRPQFWHDRPDIDSVPHAVQMMRDVAGSAARTARRLPPVEVTPIAIEKIGEQLFVFYGMADSKIGVAKLDRIPAAS